MTASIDALIDAAIERRMREVLPPIISQVLDERERRPRYLSATAAARRARRRMQVVLEALESGKLKGRFLAQSHGGKGEWRIEPDDLDRWAARQS